MYWIYLILFILAVLVPDLVGNGFYFLSETRVEEFLIFILGMAGFLIFIFKEHQLSQQESETEKNKKRLFRATKDLAESYSYIGEVNRKMEIIMQIGLGSADKSELTKKKEQEIYNTIIIAANSLMKAQGSCIRFVDMATKKTEKEMFFLYDCKEVKNADLVEMGEKINIKKTAKHILAASPKSVKNVKGYLIVENYNELEASNANNQEMLKFLAAQALFLYAYMKKE